MHRFVRENSLTLVFLGLFLASLVFQAIAGHSAFNDEQDRVQGPHLSLWRYVFSSSYGVSVMENWQSEYLQFTLFILLTVWLLQRGRLNPSSSIRPAARQTGNSASDNTQNRTPRAGRARSAFDAPSTRTRC